MLWRARSTNIALCLRRSGLRRCVFDHGVDCLGEHELCAVRVVRIIFVNHPLPMLTLTDAGQANLPARGI